MTDTDSKLSPKLELELVLGDDAQAAALFARHFALMHSQGPAESCHVMTLDTLREAGARVYALRDGSDTAAIGALKTFGTTGVELKSMHVAAERRGEGLGRVLLDALLAEAGKLGATSAWLETGSYDAFIPARGLYKRAGFAECPPFGDYSADPLSVFMTRSL